MHNLKKNLGITIISLVVTIIILLILAGVTIYVGTDSIDITKDEKLISELDMISNAAFQQYAKYTITNNSNDLKGTEIELSQVENIASQMGVTLVANKDYYVLDKTTLEQIGIENSEDEYIVNYEYGEVLNKTKIKTQSGTALYKILKTN